MDEENKAVEEVQEEPTPEVKEEPKVEEVKAEEDKSEDKGGKGKVVLAVAAVIILLILVTKFGGKKTAPTTTVETPTPTIQTVTFKVGEKITAGTAVISVSKVEVSKGSGKNIPAEGNEWLDVSMTVENKGETKQTIKASDIMLVKDAEGNSYEVTATDKAANIILDGTVAADRKRTGWVGFEVKTGAKGLQLVVNTTQFGGENILINLE